MWRVLPIIYKGSLEACPPENIFVGACMWVFGLLCILCVISSREEGGGGGGILHMHVH